ncbi:MAG: DUF2933 domain-containing protein [Anaerolineae bacterium]|nr:DUF2933 domain-containing protein [Anaerolineae bacterium]
MHKKHLLIMLVCCLVPIIGLALAAFLSVPLGKVGFYGIMLVCSLLHLVMMRHMLGGNHEVQDTDLSAESGAIHR